MKISATFKVLAIFLAIGTAGVIAGVAPATAAVEKPKKAANLDELLEQVRAGWNKRNMLQKQREADFLKARDQQKALLAEVKAKIKTAEERSERLEKNFAAGEIKIAEQEETLRKRLGNMGELFGVIRQVAGDTRSHIEASLTSAQFPGRTKKLTELAGSKTLPSLEQLQLLWIALQQEMTESGKVVRFKAPVTDINGITNEQDVVRIGVFNAIVHGEYVTWDSAPEVQKLTALSRQPPGRYLSTLEGLKGSGGENGLIRVAIDPSRGAILKQLIRTPSWKERLEFGGAIGLIIMILGLITFFVAILRLVYLFIVSIKVGRQQKSATASTGNPLGRVLVAAKAHETASSETLELKIEEAVIGEQSRLERFLWAIKVVAAVAPLMGLLGTVTGMINTFQAIQLFGAGDPKLMAGGISEALITTMLGLVVAIPLVLIHSWLKSIVRNVVDILSERSAGIIATKLEGKGNA